MPEKDYYLEKGNLLNFIFRSLMLIGEVFWKDKYFFEIIYELMMMKEMNMEN
jgi:hypothetical protein